MAFFITALPMSTYLTTAEDLIPEKLEISKTPQRLTEEVVEYIENFIEKQMNRKMIPGLGVGLVEGNEVVLAKGYGVKSINTGEAVDADTLFHIGSVNKSFTSLLAACLVDEGILSWTSTVNEMRSDWEMEDEELEKITVFDLLSMTSGILDRDEDDFWDDYGDVAVPANVFSFLSDFELARLPGEKFSYSNLAVSFGGYLFVYASGGNTDSLNHGYSDLLNKYVFSPVGMNASTIFISEAREYGNIALPHEKIKKRVVVADSEDRDDDPMAPSGSIKSNVNDMNKYLITQLQEGTSAEGVTVVSAVNLTKTWEPTRISRRAKYGMGWESKTISKTRVVSHEGAYDNFTSVVILLPEKNVGMVILANTEYVGSLLRKADRIIIKAMKKYKTF